MANKVRHTLHRRSSVNTPKTIKIERGTLEIQNPKAPTADNIEYGEIAINYGKDSESLFIKNENNEVIRINSISNIRYDGDVDSSLEKYLDDRYINTSGDTMYGSFTIKGQPGFNDRPTFKYEGTDGFGSFEVKSNDTSISGNNLNITEDESIINSSNTSISGSNLNVTENKSVIKSVTTDFDGTNVDYDVNDTNISGETLNITENKSIINNKISSQITTPNLDIDATKTTVDGESLTITEKNTKIDTSIFDLSGTTTNMEGTNLTVDYDNINLSGNTEIQIDTPLLDVNSTDTTIDGNNLTVTEKNTTINSTNKFDVNSNNVHISGTTTNMEGTDLTVDYDNINLSGNTVNISGNTTVKVDTPLLNVDSEDITVDGNNLTVTEKNTTINSTNKFDVNSNNVHISGTTTNMEGTDLTVDYDNINISGNTEINIDTPDLNISSEEVSVSGNNLTINETSSTTINSNESFTVNSNHVNISGKTDINIDGPKLDIDVTNTTIDGSSLIINEGDKVDVNSKLVHISGTTTNMEGDTLNVEYKNINSTATTVVNNFSGVTNNITEEKNIISTQNNKITNINTTATTQTQHVTNENDYFTNWNVSSTTINITGETTNMSGNTLTLDYKTINISGDTNISKTLNVSGDTHLHSNLKVEGDIILNPNKKFKGKLENNICLTSGDVKTFNSSCYNNESAVSINIPTKTSHINIDSISIVHDETKESEPNVREAYKLMGNNSQLGKTITIYKDSSLLDVKFENQHLYFTYILENGDKKTIDIDVSAFLTDAEYGDGLKVVDGVISVKHNTAGDGGTYLVVDKDGVGLKGITDGLASARTEVKEGADNSHLSISSSTATDGHDIYTITLSDVASEDAFTKHHHDDRYVNVSGDTMTGALTVQSTITATGAIYSSDRTLKKDIELISQKDIESVGKIDLKSYKFKDDETNRERYGVIAQELEDVNLSNLVVEGDNGKKGVDYISFLILKIAQLEQEIKELKNR